MVSEGNSRIKITEPSVMQNINLLPCVILACTTGAALLLSTDPSLPLAKIMAQEARLQGLLILLPLSWLKILNQENSCCRKCALEER